MSWRGLVDENKFPFFKRKKKKHNEMFLLFGCTWDQIWIRLKESDSRLRGSRRENESCSSPLSLTWTVLPWWLTPFSSSRVTGAYRETRRSITAPFLHLPRVFPLPRLCLPYSYLVWLLIDSSSHSLALLVLLSLFCCSMPTIRARKGEKQRTCQACPCLPLRHHCQA